MGREPFAPHLIPVASPPPDGGSLHSTDFFDGDLTKKWGGNLDRLMVMTDAMRAPVGAVLCGPLSTQSTCRGCWGCIVWATVHSEQTWTGGW